MTREEVIKGFECCIITPDFCRDDCPYIGKGDENDYCDEKLFKDALALLKAQEPRMLTLEEVNKLEQNEVVWLEDKGINEVIPAIVVEHGHRYAQRSVCLMIVENPRLWVETFDYKERWRCWTSRPTDEQREVTPWN